MRGRLAAAGLAMLGGVVSGCTPAGLQVRNQTGEPIWITMHLSDGMVEEAGLIDNGEAVLMRTPFEGVDRIEYRAGGVDCRMDREAMQDAVGPRGTQTRTILLKPCSSMGGPE